MPMPGGLTVPETPCLFSDSSRRDDSGRKGRRRARSTQRILAPVETRYEGAAGFGRPGERTMLRENHRGIPKSSVGNHVASVGAKTRFGCGVENNSRRQESTHGPRTASGTFAATARDSACCASSRGQHEREARSDSSDSRGFDLLIAPSRFPWPECRRRGPGWQWRRQSSGCSDGPPPSTRPCGSHGGSPR